jgi:hypothetical protein
VHLAAYLPGIRIVQTLARRLSLAFRALMWAAKNQRLKTKKLKTEDCITDRWSST